MKARVFPVFILGLCILIVSLGLLRTLAGAAHESQRPDTNESFSPLGDTFAYMANGRGTGLQVIEVSDPVSPREVGFYDTPGHVLDIAIQDRSGAEENSSEQSWPSPCLGNREVRIEVLPNTPTEGESIILRISGISGDFCVPEYLAHEIQVNSIDVYAGEPSCTGICIAVPIAWAFDVELGALPPGLYAVRFYVVCQWPIPPPPPSGWECLSMTYTVAPCYDFNGNGQVDIEDIQGVVDRWRQQAGLSYDCDGDEFITVRDIMCAVARWGETCA